MPSEMKPDLFQPAFAGVSNRTMHVLGAGALLANRLRYLLGGYRCARSFGASDVERSVEYDCSVVRRWRAILEEYRPSAASLDGREVLEIGPGPDLGVGLLLRAAGAAGYTAFDANRLLRRTPERFYDAMLERISAEGFAEDTVAELRKDVEAFRTGTPRRLRYVHSRKGDLGSLGEARFDLIVSQAVFEHLADPAATLHALSEHAKPGAILLAVVDLKTHSGWLRRRDPLNIYRFSKFYYDLVRYRGRPNRLRPADYVNLLAANGWRDIRVEPLSVLDEQHLARVQPHLARPYRREEAQMRLLSIALLATAS